MHVNYIQYSKASTISILHAFVLIKPLMPMLSSLFRDEAFIYLQIFYLTKIFGMMVNVQDICENMRLAREMALTSQYGTAEIYYQGVVQQIHRLLATIQEPNRKTRWQQVQQQVAAEYEQLKELISTISMFKSDNPTCMDDRPLGSTSLRISAFEEPTRDPDVWPPPPPRDNDWPQPTTADHRVTQKATRGPRKAESRTGRATKTSSAANKKASDSKSGPSGGRGGAGDRKTSKKDAADKKDDK
ncbi:hypothetical protein Anas_05173, partial [Armadillidium nasatum]